ncbi:hypothetical protein M0Q39_01735 [Patescibacteria group bacterium]|jgi:hypothetical protein|nr:hypothetical protein [Patescibacteria group bacterium]
MPIPTSLIFLILGTIGLIIYFTQKKKQNKFNKIYLILGVVLILVGIIPGILLSLQNNDFIDEDACEKLNEVECLEHQDTCSLCGETVVSNYLSCHSKQFCVNASTQVTDKINIAYNPTPREQAIERYLLIQKHFSWKNRDDSYNFCTIKNLKPDQELFPLYIWAYCGEYVIENNKLVTVSGSSGPVKIDYPNELSYYDINKFSYEAPGDGADYTKDIKKIFPEDVQRKIFDHDVDELIVKAEDYAFTNITNWNLIKQAIAECEIESVMQTHALEVTATFKNGEEITAREPKIDDIFDIVDQYKDKCGEIIMATE